MPWCLSSERDSTENNAFHVEHNKENTVPQTIFESLHNSRNTKHSPLSLISKPKALGPKYF